MTCLRSPSGDLAEAWMGEICLVALSEQSYHAIRKAVNRLHIWRKCPRTVLDRPTSHLPDRWTLRVKCGEDVSLSVSIRRNAQPLRGRDRPGHDQFGGHVCRYGGGAVAGADLCGAAVGGPGSGRRPRDAAL